MNLIIDIGNTRIKIAVFNSDKLIYNEVITKNEFVNVTLKLVEKFNCKNAIISSVGILKKNEKDQIKAKINVIELNSDTKIPFINNYGTPKTLGVDRIALVAAAVLKYKNKNVLIIDAGTCITYDFVTKDKKYLGGAISPGIQMRYKSLNTFTEKLPLLNAKEGLISLIGESTETSIHSGVINGVISEIDSVIDKYRKKNKELTIVLTGGDVNFLSNKLKNGIFANPIFLLEGLNTILTYNLQ
ncbi:type III pantothenate kinase [Lutibacter sp. A80]|uniref:type III pantothenate kinase n=1 Tax=Lutibacter sp. A80 TaxID=2918453 RepID=UPI001F05F968|nr:type III pantothenate kinase [Lutibacter sp. A80]UMB60267.1 type III pantothenate kinase [Lutibacter sp. A80]